MATEGFFATKTKVQSTHARHAADENVGVGSQVTKDEASLVQNTEDDRVVHLDFDVLPGLELLESPVLLINCPRKGS